MGRVREQQWAVRPGDVWLVIPSEEVHNARCLSWGARGVHGGRGRRGSRPGSVRRRRSPPPPATRVLPLTPTFSERTRRLYQVGPPKDVKWSFERQQTPPGMALRR